MKDVCLWHVLSITLPGSLSHDWFDQFRICIIDHSNSKQCLRRKSSCASVFFFLQFWPSFPLRITNAVLSHKDALRMIQSSTSSFQSLPAIRSISSGWLADILFLILPSSFFGYHSFLCSVMSILIIWWLRVVTMGDSIRRIKELWKKELFLNRSGSWYQLH